MMPLLDQLVHRLAQADAVLVRVDRSEGSVPREAGTWMAVWREAQLGTIGGGRLEFEALEIARRLLAQPSPAPCTQRFPLGPSLGQCCGGVVWLRFARVGAAEAASLARELSRQLTPVAVFGGGHVGVALTRLLATLPFQVRWIDSRDAIFPADLPAQVEAEHSDPVQDAVTDLPVGSRVLIMSFSHAEDLDIVMACLRRLRVRDDLPYVGLIGSRSKWATFAHRLQERGFSDDELARITCPIGLPGISGKEPEVIAVAVAAQLLALPAEGGAPVA